MKGRNCNVWSSPIWSRRHHHLRLHPLDTLGLLCQLKGVTVAGKWRRKDVPNHGWICVGIEDTGALCNTCEMCESASIRYVHWMEHAEYTTLGVGCVCAGKMEGDHENASSLEKTYKSKARRRANWPGLSGWRISKNGNLYINKDGLNIVIFQQRGYWSFRVTHRETSRSKYSQRQYETQPRAQLGAFDAVVWLQERGWPLSERT